MYFQLLPTRAKRNCSTCGNRTYFLLYSFSVSGDSKAARPQLRLAPTVMSQSPVGVDNRAGNEIGILESTKLTETKTGNFTAKLPKLFKRIREKIHFLSEYA